MALDEHKIQKTTRQLRKFLNKSSKTPGVEQIHKLRSHTRRFETTLDALGLASRKNERQLLRDLERLRKRAGKIRDMDVLTGYVADVHVNGSEKECLVRLLQHLGAERYRHAAKLDRAVQEKRSELKRRLKRAAKHLSRIEASGKSPSYQHDGAPVDAMAFALNLSAELSKPPVLNQRNLHPYRLRVKELRYVLQMADAPGGKDFIARLQHVQDAIGEWHDWVELIAIAGEVLDHGNGCGFIRQLKSISKKKYQEALSLTNKMRNQYLVSNATKSKHAPRSSVLKATSSIAA